MRTSERVKSCSVLGRSSRKRELKDWTWPFCQGEPGTMRSVRLLAPLGR